MSEHAHREHIEGCYRCDLSREEAREYEEYTPKTVEMVNAWHLVRIGQEEGWVPPSEREAEFYRWLSAEIAAAEKRGAVRAIRDAAERVKRSFTGEVHYEALQEHADMIRDDEVDWQKPARKEQG